MLPPRRLPLVCFTLLFAALPVPAAPPMSLDDRLVIERIASEPDIVTPTGVAMDPHGDIWVVENHTHQRPAGYKGPETDRIRVFSDFGPDGKARKVRTFADGFRDTMSIALRDDGVYIATRAVLYRLRDTDGDGKADERVTLVRLETKGNYPHNGLSGFAFDAHGTMVFGLGENLGEAYRLIGSDGSTLSGGGEGGSVYRCRPDGSKLERIATGFWNPFHQAFDAFGRLFIVDNDPDSRGPCRLVHVVEGGDYGYRFRYGRKGLHPFVCWNGELPGTLPMASGTAEAPSGVVAYESDNLPADYRGKLLVTSWGDHVVEVFDLVKRGASVEAKGKVLLRGGEDFRPVGIAVAPDGSLVLSDWVDKSYPVHGRGGLWRVRAKKSGDDGMRPEKVKGLEPKRLRELLTHRKLEVRRAAASELVARGDNGLAVLGEALRGKDERGRLEALWALTRGNSNPARLGLADPAPEVRVAALGLSGLVGIDLLKPFLKDNDPSVQRAAILQSHSDLLVQVIPFLDSDDPFLVSAALMTLGRRGNARALMSQAKDANPRRRLGALLALRATGEELGRSTLPDFLADADPAVRRAAIQWVGEEMLKEHAEAMRAAAGKAPVSREVFTAWLAAESLLAGAKPDRDEVIEDTLLRVLKAGNRPAAVQAMALRMLRPDHPLLKTEDLRKLVTGRDAELRTEAIRSLALRADDGSQAILRDIAPSRDNGLSLRLTATAGLGRSAMSSAETRRTLLGLLDESAVRRDALRSLRGTAATELAGWWEKLPRDPEKPTPEFRELAGQLASALRGTKDTAAEKLLPSLDTLGEPRPAAVDAWQKALASGGDAEAGERLFFHTRGANCSTCHRIDGRGGETGPDLSVIGRTFDRMRLVRSILLPSEEISPRYVAWRIATRGGRVLTGTIALEGHDSTLTLVDAEGKTVKINRLDVEERMALPTSIMPDNLHTLMTAAEFRDLIAYLESRK